jgi:hypothetical protein
MDGFVTTGIFQVLDLGWALAGGRYEKDRYLQAAEDQCRRQP